MTTKEKILARALEMACMDMYFYARWCALREGKGKEFCSGCSKWRKGTAVVCSTATLKEYVRKATKELKK